MRLFGDDSGSRDVNAALGSLNICSINNMDYQPLFHFLIRNLKSLDKEIVIEDNKEN